MVKKIFLIKKKFFLFLSLLPLIITCGNKNKKILPTNTESKTKIIEEKEKNKEEKKTNVASSNKDVLTNNNVSINNDSISINNNDNENNKNDNEKNDDEEKHQAIINEIKQDFIHIDVNDDHTINTQVIRCQRCQALIDKINRYQEKKSCSTLFFYRLATEQKLSWFKHYHQSLFGKIIIIIVNVWFIIDLFLVFYMMIKKTESKEEKITKKNVVVEKSSSENSKKQKTLTGNNSNSKSKKQTSFVNPLYPISTISESQTEQNQINQTGNSSFVFQEIENLELRKPKIFITYTYINKNIQKYFVNKNLLVLSNKTKIIFKCYQLFYTCCFFFFVNYGLNCLFNNYNERLYNSINLFIRHQRYLKIELNGYLFVNEDQIKYFLYDNSMYFVYDNGHESHGYYYVPLIFDRTSNYFLAIFKIIYTCLALFIIPYYGIFAYYYYNLTYVINVIFDCRKDNNKNETYFHSEELTAIFFNTVANPNMLNFCSRFKLLINNNLIACCSFLIPSKNDETYDNDTKLSENEIKNKKITKIILFYKYLFMYKDLFFFFVFTLMLFSFSFDYFYLFSCGEEDKNRNVLTALFYGQHYFNEIIKRFFKSLPIINRFYFDYAVTCERLYLIFFVVTIMLPILIIFVIVKFSNFKEMIAYDYDESSNINNTNLIIDRIRFKVEEYQHFYHAIEKNNLDINYDKKYVTNTAEEQLDASSD